MFTSKEEVVAHAVTAMEATITDVQVALRRSDSLVANILGVTKARRVTAETLRLLPHAHFGP